MGDLFSAFAVMGGQSYWIHHIQINYVFPLKALEIFAWIVPVKLNYESIVDGRGSKVSSFLKMALNEISEAAPRSVVCFYKSYVFIKVFSNIKP